ncbi:MAG: lysine biosynthesis protein LysW [Candidatus Dormibacteria bacterium]|jgi:alpha-aminoadipate carrier protein LysW
MAAATAACPECDAQVEIGDDAEVGEILSCPECGADLEIRGLAPARLDVAPPEEEDWGE